MTLFGLIVLLAIAAAIAVATMRRTRPESRISEAQRLPPRDENAGLGLSAVRPVAPREPVTTAPAEPAARPAAPRPVVRPVAESVATPVARPARPRDRVDDALASAPEETGAPLDALYLPADAIEAGREADQHDAPQADAPALPADERPASADLSDRSEPDEDVHPENGAGDADPAHDDAVWTFDQAAAEPAADPVERPAYVRDGQALWPSDATAPALLAASLAARLGGSVAVLRHDAACYLVEMLAGPAAADVPPPIDATGHPLDRVPQDGVLSLLGPSTPLPYLHGAPAGQVLVRSLGAPPAARVLLVADVPPDAPDIDGPTATLVDGYADLLAGLTLLPLAEDQPEEQADDSVDDDLLTLLIAEPPAPEPEEPAEPDPADAAEDEMPESVRGDESDDAPEPAGLTHARDATVAAPGARRGAVSPPPRGVILSGEIAAARRDRRLLVFALVTVADAETVLRGGADGIVQAEAALRQRLTAGAGVRRVEPFGDLLFGVFLDAEGPEVVAWAERLSSQGRPLLVGAVPATGSPDLVRATATAALQSAYEREVVCVVAS